MKTIKALEVDKSYTNLIRKDTLKDVIKLIDEIKYTWNLDEVIGVRELKTRIEG